MNQRIHVELDSAFVSDPHVVFIDAVQHSPWGDESDARLPARDEWSTFRYATKDIILGAVTHRYNRSERRLEVRAYFVGEHPMFLEFEPTKALLIILMCQCFMIDGSVELYFENRVPFDIRELIERRLGVVVNGHGKSLDSELCRRLFPALSGLPDWAIDQLHAEPHVAPEKPCFFAYRGVWTTDHLLSILRRRVPLRWLYAVKPNLLRNPLLYSSLVRQLKSVLLEQYALERLRNRPMGASWGNSIRRCGNQERECFTCQSDLDVDDGVSHVKLEAGREFVLEPRLTLPFHGRATKTNEPTVICVPTGSLTRQSEAQDVEQLCVAGVTDAQLESEVELKLAIVADDADEDELDRSNLDRYAD